MKGNPANDEAKKSVERALKDRWLDGDFLVKNLSDVESLPCYGLGWGDAEIIKLASAIEYACANGALASCQELYLNDNKVGDVGLTALASVLGSGALPQLKVANVYLGGNPGNAELVKGVLRERKGSK